MPEATEKVSLLQEYLATKEYISKKREKYERMRALCEKTTNIITGLPGGGSGGTKDAAYAKMIDLARELSVDEGGLAYVRDNLRKAIGCVDDWRLRVLLGWRYLLGRSWDEIAREIGVPACTVRGRMHQKAIDALNMVESIDTEHKM